VKKIKSKCKVFLIEQDSCSSLNVNARMKCFSYTSYKKVNIYELSALLSSCHRPVIGPQLKGNCQNGSSICLGKDSRQWVRLRDCLGNRDWKLGNEMPHLHNAGVNPLDPNLNQLS